MEQKSSNVVGRAFTSAYSQITDVIPYHAEWENGTGYLDHAVSLVKLEPGSVAKSATLNNRRIIFIGTRFGTVVVFDRYSNQDEDGTYVTNAPNNIVIKQMISNSAVGEREMYTIVGAWNNVKENIGYTIEKMAKVFESGK